MPIKFKETPVEVAQHQLFPSNVFDLLPELHDCFIYHDIFQQINTSELNCYYSPKGQRAYAPLQIISILIYGKRSVVPGRSIVVSDFTLPHEPVLWKLKQKWIE